MTEINKPKLNLDALKWNFLKNKAENQDKKDIIENKSTHPNNKISIGTTQKENFIKNNNVEKNVEKEQKNNNINKNISKKLENNENIVDKQNKNNINPFNKKTENIDPIQRITENLTKNNKENKKESDNTDNIIKENKNLENQNTNNNLGTKNINKEIFSGYTSDFMNKKEEAIKESKKIKFPDSPKKIFFAIFSSLLILSSLVFIIIFKVDSPITNKLKTNILEIAWKKEQKIIKQKKKIIKMIWTNQEVKQLWFTLKYQLSNTNKYKIDWKILNNKNEFDNYIQNKIEKLKIEKLKKHLQEEKEKNTNSK